MAVLGGEEGRGFSQDLLLHAQHPVLPTELDQLVTLGGGQALLVTLVDGRPVRVLPPLPIGVVLLMCPLMMVFMMRGISHSDHFGTDHNQHAGGGRDGGRAMSAP